MHAIDSVHGGVTPRVAVGRGPHDLTAWPHADRYRLGRPGDKR